MSLIILSTFAIIFFIIFTDQYCPIHLVISLTEVGGSLVLWYICSVMCRRRVHWCFKHPSLCVVSNQDFRFYWTSSHKENLFILNLNHSTPLSALSARLSSSKSSEATSVFTFLPLYRVCFDVVGRAGSLSKEVISGLHVWVIITQLSPISNHRHHIG